MKTLQGKVIVITGAASGIGQTLALALAAKNANLLLADLNEAGLQTTAELARAAGAGAGGAGSSGSAKGTQVLTHVTDTGSEAAIFALADFCKAHFGAADVVVNNAGVSLVSSVEQLKTDDAQWLMNINFWGVVHGCRAFLPQLKTRPESLLVNVSSIFAMVSIPTQSMYNASKAAVRGFSDALRQELRDGPVQVLCVHPGGIQTNIANNARMSDLSLIELTVPQLKQNFLQNAHTTPVEAAQAIVKAIEGGKTRLMIGADAKIMDGLYRLWPAKASGWLTQLSRRQRDKYKSKTT